MKLPKPRHPCPTLVCALSPETIARHFEAIMAISHTDDELVAFELACRSALL